MRDDSGLVWVHNRQFLVLNEALGVVNVPLHVRNALVDLGLSLHDRLAHFLSDQARVHGSILREDVLQIAQLFKPSMNALVTFCILHAEALVRAFQSLVKLTIGYSFEGAVKLVVFRVDRPERHTHRIYL